MNVKTQTEYLGLICILDFFPWWSDEGMRKMCVFLKLRLKGKIYIVQFYLALGVMSVGICYLMQESSFRLLTQTGDGN